MCQNCDQTCACCGAPAVTRITVVTIGTTRLDLVPPEYRCERHRDGYDDESEEMAGCAPTRQAS